MEQHTQRPSGLLLLAGQRMGVNRSRHGWVATSEPGACDVHGFSSAEQQRGACMPQAAEQPVRNDHGFALTVILMSKQKPTAATYFATLQGILQMQQERQCPAAFKVS